jgi:hypothetical protein
VSSLDEQNAAELRDLEKRFRYHPPYGNQVERYQVVRDWGNKWATSIVSLCPPSRERSLALTKIEEAVMWANAAIARREPGPPTNPHLEG